MSLARFWSTVKLLHFSSPAGDRPLYHAVRGRAIRSVLEVNIGDAMRSERLVTWLRSQGAADEAIRYAAVDAFEAGGEGHLTLKSCHSRLGKLGVKPLPVPRTGSLSIALTRVAHTIGAVDLMILDCDQAEREDPSVQAIMPRLLHGETIFLARQAGRGELVCIPVEPFSPQPVRKAA